jgi:hypothetical protein
MIVGDLHSGAGKLEQAIKNLQLHWELTRQMWHDSASRSFEDNHLADLLPQVKTVLEATQRITEVLDKAQHEVT